MIQANTKIKISSPIGLQLNNLVYNQHGELHAIRSNDFHRFNHPDMGGDYSIYAVPLSPEMFEACGAVLNDWYKKEIKLGEFSITTLNSNDAEYGLYFGDTWTGIKLNWLHQMQKLIHSLTGKELELQTIKL